MHNCLRYLLIFFSINICFSLEVQLTKEYYNVGPGNIGDVNHPITMISKAGIKHFGYNSIGSYTALTEIKTLNINYENGMCYTEKFELMLKGVMILPRLKMGNYLLKIRQAFEEESERLQVHEYEHEQIWKQSLNDFETKIRKLRIEDNEQCFRLIDEVNQKMALTLSEIMQKNIQFDCVEYGYQLDLAECG